MITVSGTSLYGTSDRIYLISSKSNLPLLVRNWATLSAVKPLPSSPILSNNRTVAFPVGARSNTPPALISGWLHNTDNTVVLPVPASPTRTDILDFASSSRIAAFSCLARSSCSESGISFPLSSYSLNLSSRSFLQSASKGNLGAFNLLLIRCSIISSNSCIRTSL